jgi:hypothetical protein
MATVKVVHGSHGLHGSMPSFLPSTTHHVGACWKEVKKSVSILTMDEMNKG